MLVARHPDTSQTNPLSCQLEYFNQFLLNLVSFACSASPCLNPLSALSHGQSSAAAGPVHLRSLRSDQRLTVT